MSFHIAETSFSETPREISKSDSNYDPDKRVDYNPDLEKNTVSHMSEGILAEDTYDPDRRIEEIYRNDSTVEKQERYDPDERVNIKDENFENEKHEIEMSKEKELQITEFEKYKNDVQNSPELTEQEKGRYIKQINEITEGIKKGIENLSTKEKGNFGEMCTDVDMLKQEYKRISEDSVTDLFQSGRQGIDGVYENKDGIPRYVITDSKYGSSQLKETQDGKQLSSTWIDKRLDDAVGKEKADEIRLEKIFDANNVDVKIAHVDENGKITYETVDRNGNTQYNTV